MDRVLRTGGSFAVVLIAYWAYTLVAVPRIEPAARRYDGGSPSEADRHVARHRIDRQLSELEGLFPPGAWELDHPKILESGSVKLLVKNHVNLGKGNVEIRPCTFIFTPEDPDADAAELRRRAVIMEAPEGALLEFDRPLDFRRADIGRIRLISARLNGRITIRSAGKSPTSDDDLWIVTRNVALTEELISTPDSVEFRWGRSHGSGSRMRIKLASNSEEGKPNDRGPSFTGIESFELEELEHLYLHVGKSPRPSTGPGVETGSQLPGGNDLPVEIRCRGPFRYDHLRQVATFEKNVDVLRIHPDGPADQITCELLSVYFARRREGIADLSKADSTAKKRGTSAEFDLEPCRIEAHGTPVVVRAPSLGVHARGERFEYDLQTQEITLEGMLSGREVFLRQDTNEIHARSLHYQSAGPGRLGQITARGPGRFLGQTGDNPVRELRAVWNEMLYVRPHEGQHVISLSGAPELESPEIGRLTADEIHFWFSEIPPDEENRSQPDRARSLKLRPDRLAATGQVRLDSPQLTGAVDELGIWFVDGRLQGPSLPAGRVTGRITGAVPVHPSQTAENDQPPIPAARGPGEPAAARPHFEIEGSVLWSQVVIREGQSELSELTVEGNVVFRETQTTRADERPLQISGDQIRLTGANTLRATVTVIGRPARFEGRGLELQSTNINLDRGGNRLWVHGAGQMCLPLDRDLQGEPLAEPDVLDIRWQESMEFDGRTASFTESVVASSRTQWLKTDALDVILAERVDFAHPDRDQEPDVVKIVCRGDVSIQSRTFDEAVPLSVERMQVADLTIDRNSGDLEARGPGRITTVRRGSSLPLGLGVDRTANRDPPAPDDPNDDRLTYLEVSFQGRLYGNLHDRKVTFEDRVRTVYGPVDSWEATLDVDDPDALGPKGVVLSCDRLDVVEMAVPGGGGSALELEATGNTMAENRTFTARAPEKMTYAAAKDLLILEGNGRADAELFRQEQVGGATHRVSARKISYWPSTKQLKVSEGRSLEIGRFPSK